jgi:hypothetical protein
MQTFLPYADFELSARILDYKRLGKQRVEALQIHNIVSGKRTTGGWLNHPAVRMWRGFADLLAYYHNAMIDEWVRRGYQNNMPYIMVPPSLTQPVWLGYEPFHLSHRSALLQKLPDHYSKYFPANTPTDLPYHWPESGFYNW